MKRYTILPAWLFISLFLLSSCATTQAPKGLLNNIQEVDLLSHLVLLDNTSKKIHAAVEEVTSQGSIGKTLLRRLGKKQLTAPIARYNFKLIHLYAMYGKDPDILVQLISLDKDPFEPESLYQASPLHLAAWRNENTPIVQTLLDNGHPIDVIDVDGDTPLHWAATRNTEPAIIQTLVNAGYDPNLLDKNLDSLLHLAIVHNKNAFDIVSLLLDLGASPGVYNKEGLQPLHLVPRFAADIPELIQLLVAYGAPINALTTQLEETPLHIAAEYSTVAIILQLLEAKADATLSDANGYTAIHKAAWGNPNPEVIEFLISLYENPNIREPLYNATPLHVAAWNNSNTTVMYTLITEGANINAQDRTGDTPLHIAVTQNDNPLIFADTLLSLGADPFIENNRGTTAAELITENPIMYILSETIQLLREESNEN